MNPLSDQSESVCNHCERTFDETEDTFVSESGGDICAHCAATWLGEERDRLTGALRAIAAMDPATGYVQQDTARRALEPALTRRIVVAYDQRLADVERENERLRKVLRRIAAGDVPGTGDFIECVQDYARDAAEPAFDEDRER